MQFEQVKIERTGLMGQGVGKDLLGNIYFVPGTVPGDEVKVSFQDTKKYRDAEIVEILTPSSERVPSPCSAFPECGGCDWLFWDYNAQVNAKEESLKHVLERGDLKAEEYLPFEKSPKIWGYRNRIQVRQDGEVVGFFKKKSHTLVSIEECKVANPKINKKIQDLKKEKTSHRRKVEISLTAQGEISVLENRNHAFEGFRQINEEQNKFLKERVMHFIRLSGSKKVLELFCGDGNLSFPALELVEEWIGVDSNPKAIELARSKKEAGCKGAFFCDDVNRKLKAKLPQEFMKTYDTLIVDPPRDGVALNGLDEIKEYLSPSVKNIIYISCNPVSFSKDVQCLKKDYSFRSIQGIDMFPHTRHIELIAYFSRG